MDLDQPFSAAAYAVVDIETTGFRPGYDRIVEICVVRLDPGEPPRIALDTLVDPRRPVTAMRVHGIEPADVVGAPSFPELAGEILRALAGRIIVGHNVSFDRRFLAHELSDAGAHLGGPFIDTSYLRPLLGDGDRASLTDTCAAYGIQRAGAHVAAADAIDTMKLLQVLLQRATFKGLRTFADLRRCGDHAFLSSLELEVGSPADATALPPCSLRRSRSQPSANPPLRAYYEALLLVIADGVVTAEEVAALAATRARLDLGEEEIFALHAQAFTGALLAGIADNKMQAHERAYLANLATCLRLLGWCPGDPLPT